MVRGANAPLAEAVVKEQIMLEQQGVTHKPVLTPNSVRAR
jgi:hypothetical protein